MPKGIPLKYRQIAGTITGQEACDLLQIEPEHAGESKQRLIAGFKHDLLKGLNYAVAYVPKKYSATGKDEPVAFVKFSIINGKLITKKTFVKENFRRSKIGQKINQHLWGFARSHGLGFEKHNQNYQMMNMIWKYLSQRKHYGAQEKKDYPKGKRSAIKSETIEWPLLEHDITNAKFMPHPSRKRPKRPL